MTDFGGKTSIFSHPVYLFLRKFSLQDSRGGSQYQFDFGLRPSLGYVLSKGKDIEGIGDEDLVNYIDVGATYYFNKNMSAFVDYKINQLDSDNKLNINNDDIVAVGMTYQF